MSPYEVIYVSFFLFFIYKTMFLLDVCAYRQRSAGEDTDLHHLDNHGGPRPLKKVVLDVLSSSPSPRPSTRSV